MMGKTDIGDRVTWGLIAIAAGFALLNGMAMLIRPLDWYMFVPTVRFTGPPNAHFIRDIGLAYLSCGAVLIYALRDPAGRWLALCAGALWLSIHGFLHIYEVLTGICSTDIFWADAPGVIGVPALIWIALAILFVRRRITPMILQSPQFRW